MTKASWLYLILSISAVADKSGAAYICSSTLPWVFWPADGKLFWFFKTRQKCSRRVEVLHPFAAARAIQIIGLSVEEMSLEKCDSSTPQAGRGLCKAIAFCRGSLVGISWLVPSWGGQSCRGKEIKKKKKGGLLSRIVCDLRKIRIGGRSTMALHFLHSYVFSLANF